MLDNELRMSYRHNVHDFKSNNLPKKSAKGGDTDLEPPELMKYRMCHKCQAKYGMNKENGLGGSELAEKILMKIDKRKIVYEEEEIDYINDN